MPSLSKESHGERIAALEIGQQALQDSLKKLSDIVKEQAENAMEEHSATRTEIRMLGEKLSQIGKPNYGVIFSGVAVVVVLIGAVLWPTQTQLSQLREFTYEIARNAQEHQALPMHDGTARLLEERVKAEAAEDELRKQIEDLRFAAVDKALAAQKELFETKINQLRTQTP